MLPGVRNTHQDETAPPSTNGEQSITSIRSETTGLETEMNHITVDLQSNPDSLFCSKTDGDFGTETSGVDPQVSLNSHAASQFSPADHLADCTEMTNDYLNQHDYEDGLRFSLLDALAVLTREDRSFQFHRICRASSIQLRLELNQYAAKSNSAPLSLVLADPLVSICDFFPTLGGLFDYHTFIFISHLSSLSYQSLTRRRQ
ncbi:hypothetical protein AHF37_04996 [Paragonimus kellicotti]|nr:hypothetical protein AHF37_04996 [Paragonimus kellicotti]